ncbi:FMN-binding negative transcriptional regulator [Moraxellaceae bacterium AER2_44_116]|nr:FMN-binding negative transcriptional regulator [Moraxellaceae bacterium AER2_44_116]
MYIPPHFQEQREEVLLGLIAKNPLSAIVWQSPDGTVADHIPLSFKKSELGNGYLIGHVARNNPLWQHAANQEVLVIFQGANAYISPNWYATKQETGKVVPTWNYVAVHVYGKIRAIEDANWIFQQISTLTSLHEQSQTKPWKVTDAPSDYIDRMISAIVGIEIEITNIIGKSKMSQNQVTHNQQSVGTALNNLGSEMAKSVADLVLGKSEHI